MVPPRGRRAPVRISRALVTSPRRVMAAIGASLVIFELLHRWVRVPELVSSALLGLAFLPILILSVVAVVARLLHDPDAFLRTARHLVGLLAAVNVFFAVLYAELGITSSLAPGAEVRDFWTCLYFSVTTFTSLGFGDFVPTAETRLIAAVEALTGYVLLGLSVACAFFLLTHHARRPRG
jgi:Ion channel